MKIYDLRCVLITDLLKVVIFDNSVSGASSITRKCYSIGRVKAGSTQAVLYCTTSLSRLRLHVVR